MSDGLAMALTVLDLIGEEIEKQESHSCPVCTAVVEKLRLVKTQELEGIVESTREKYGLVCHG